MEEKLLVHGKIYAGEDMTVIPDGYVLVRDGKIADVGGMSAVPKTDGAVLDLEGSTVCPGFVDAHCHIGMWEDALGFEGDDGNESTDPVTPHLRALDAVNPMDRCFAEARQAGVTTVVTGPGSANVIGGQFVALKTLGNRIDDMVIREPCAMKMALGENPKLVYGKKGKAPVTRMAAAALIRETLYKAKEYAAKKRQDPNTPVNLKLESLLPVIDGSLMVKFHVHRADDLFTAVRIAEEFHLRYSLEHVTDGLLIADALETLNVPLNIGPVITDRSKPEMKNLTPETAAKLLLRGLPVSVITDHPVIPVQYLPLCAALLARYGVSDELMLKSITVNSARACGISNRVGSLTAGLDADLLIFEGSPLQMDAFPKVMVEGEFFA